jgi:uncharacterized protein (DUF433 family)
MADTDSNVVISAFTDEQVTRLTGISGRQLRYWAKTAFFIPSLDFGLYSFRDLVCLKIINEIRNESRVSLSHLREVKERLAHLGDDLWAKTTLYVLNKRVVFKNPETEENEEVVSGQGVLQIPLQIVSGNMNEAVKTMRQRGVEAIGKIDRQRGIAHNQPVIAGTRIAVKSIKAFADAGYSIDEIKKEYPTLTDEDIAAAINYVSAA